MHRLGISRAEIVVVAVVLLAAVALGVPYVLHLRSQSRQTMCEDRLRRLGLAVHGFDDRLGAFPGYRNLQAVDIDGQEQTTGWVFPLLPHLTSSDEESVRRFSELHAAYGPTGKESTRGQRPVTYLAEVVCPGSSLSPERRQAQPLSYVANCGMPDADVPADSPFPPDWPANGLFFDQHRPEEQRVTMSLAWLADHDGAAHTLLLTENVDAGRWTDDAEPQVGVVWVANLQEGVPSPLPLLLPINQRAGEGDGSLKFARPSSEHAGGVNIVLADGMTQFLSEEIDYLVFTRMLNADGAQVKQPGADELLEAPWRESR